MEVDSAPEIQGEINPIFDAKGLKAHGEALSSKDRGTWVFASPAERIYLQKEAVTGVFRPERQVL